MLTALALASGAAAISVDQPLSAQSGTPGGSYDEFVKLSPDARRNQFARLSDEQKAHIKRTHAERWLAANRSLVLDMPPSAPSGARDWRGTIVGWFPWVSECVLR